jgi:hypothetical protein
MKTKSIILLVVALILIGVGIFLIVQSLSKQGTNQENQTPETLEEQVADTLSNQICKKNEINPVNRYYCLAVVNDNPEFCKKIDDEEDQVNLCFAVASANSSYCKNMQPLPKHVCYYQTAVASKNINICDEIDYDENERLQCYFNFVINLYWWDKSSEIKTEYCNKFPADQPDKSTCLAFKDRDVSLCKDNIHCLTFFEQDMSFCTGKGSTLGDCVRDRAMTSKDLSICETMSGEKRDDCIGDFCTHIILDTSICDKISDDMVKQSRYVEVAVHTSNKVRGE